MCVQRAGPKWALQNLAALYWRAVGNLWNGVECLRGVLGDEEAVLGTHQQPYHDRMMSFLTVRCFY
jgi:hypothetical protein